MTKPVVFIRDADPPWEQCSTLEAWVEKMLALGTQHDAEVIQVLKSLPEAVRGKYRLIWKKYRG